MLMRIRRTAVVQQTAMMRSTQVKRTSVSVSSHEFFICERKKDPSLQLECFSVLCETGAVEDMPPPPQRTKFSGNKHGRVEGTHMRRPTSTHWFLRNFVFVVSW